jgi:hypothetical protein
VENLGRLIIIIGVITIVIGGLVLLAGRFGLPLGRLPGDFRFQSGNVTCFFPLATMLILSVVLTLLVNLIARLFR